MRFPRSRSCLSRWVIYLLFSSQLPRRDWRTKKFSRQNPSAAYSSSYKDANVESNEKSENRDTKYRTLTAVVDPNCAIDILSVCIMWLDTIKVKISESFFFFLLLLLSSLVAKKQKILLVFSDEPRGENKREMKKSKKNLHTVTIYINCALPQRVAEEKVISSFLVVEKTFVLLLLVFLNEGTSKSSQQLYSIGRNKLSLKWNACSEWKRRWKRLRWRKRPAR